MHKGFKKQAYPACRFKAALAACEPAVAVPSPTACTDQHCDFCPVEGRSHTALCMQSATSDTTAQSNGAASQHQ